MILRSSPWSSSRLVRFWLSQNIIYLEFVRAFKPHLYLLKQWLIKIPEFEINLRLKLFYKHRPRLLVIRGLTGSIIFYKSESPEEVQMKIALRVILTCKNSPNNKDINDKRYKNVVSSQLMYSNYHVLELSRARVIEVLYCICIF